LTFPVSEVATQIHSQAIVEKGAELGEDVVIEAFCYIGPKVSIGDACRVRHHATIEGDLVLGKENDIHPYALVGGMTHDLKYQGGQPKLRVGDRNVFREYVTAHVATNSEDSTEIGSDNVFLAYSHVAHDCIVGNHIVMSSHSALGGHVVVGDHVNIGWNAGIHQFCRLGRQCMVAACAKLVQDVPPFMLADGSPAEVRSINKVGMERSGFSSEEIDAARATYKVLYRSELNRQQALAELEKKTLSSSGIPSEIVSFARQSDRGLA
jgi:UDP-N-acetylglucosamine acyltransferase